MEKQTSVVIRHDAKECLSHLPAVDDALYVIGGKWKLRIIVIMRDGHKRFNELRRAVTGISARVLSNELRELELNGLVRKQVTDESPKIPEYVLTDYADTLFDVLKALNEWGTMHKEKIRREL